MGSWEGALAFCSQNTLVPFVASRSSISPLGSASRPLGTAPSVPGGLAALGGFCHRYKWAGWGRAGGETGGGEERSVCRREGPQDGVEWGSPIYVPAEEMVLHEHVLHPFLQWLLLLLLPLYWQLPVLREAEGKFAKDSQLTFDLHPARTAQE